MWNSLLSFFGGLKITAILGTVIAFLFGWIKLLSIQKGNLKEKVDAHEKEDEIIEDMREVGIKAEEKKIEALKNNDGDNWRDAI